MVQNDQFFEHLIALSVTTIAALEIASSKTHEKHIHTVTPFIGLDKLIYTAEIFLC